MIESGLIIILLYETENFDHDNFVTKESHRAYNTANVIGAWSPHERCHIGDSHVSE